MEKRKLEIEYKFNHKPTQEEINKVYKYCFNLFDYEISLKITNECDFNVNIDFLKSENMYFVLFIKLF